MKIDDCVADSVEHYVEIAVKLGTNREFNRSIREKIRAASRVLYENDAGVKELEAFLAQAAAK
jgi:predicted O-linked N-acetylglucosamine transferase (SPINDLY family)